MRCRCREMVEDQPSASQPRQDCHHVDGLETSSWQGHCQKHSNPAVINDNFGHSAWPWGGAWQSADHVGTSRRCMSINIQLSPLTPSCHSSAISRSKETVVQAFVFLRLDYCNSLLCGVTDSFVQRLQAVQNAAARLVTGNSLNVSISRQYADNSTGCQCGSTLNLRWPS